FRRWFEEAEGDIAERICSIFRAIANVACKRGWKGCGFLRTAAELVDTPGHPAVKAASRHKRNVEAWLSDVMREHGVEDAARIARQIVLLLDGAFSTL